MNVVKRQYADQNGDLHWALDRIGMRFGKLEVLRFDSFGKREPVWWCRCDCGIEKTIPTHGLRTGRTKSCGCLTRKALGKEPGDGAAHVRYMQYRRHAIKKGLAFDITEEEFKILGKSNCHYCGRPPSQTYYNNYATPFVYNGVDRIDSNIGYVTINCVSCCKTCNTAKNDMTHSEFIAWVRQVHLHLVSDSTSGAFPERRTGAPSAQRLAVPLR